VKQLEMYKRISQRRFNTENFRNKFLYLGRTYFLFWSACRHEKNHTHFIPHVHWSFRLTEMRH